MCESSETGLFPEVTPGKTVRVNFTLLWSTTSHCYGPLMFISRKRFRFFSEDDLPILIKSIDELTSEVQNYPLSQILITFN